MLIQYLILKKHRRISPQKKYRKPSLGSITIGTRLLFLRSNACRVAHLLVHTNALQKIISATPGLFPTRCPPPAPSPRRPGVMQWFRPPLHPPNRTESRRYWRRIPRYFVPTLSRVRGDSRQTPRELLGRPLVDPARSRYRRYRRRRFFLAPKRRPAKPAEAPLLPSVAPLSRPSLQQPQPPPPPLPPP